MTSQILEHKREIWRFLEKIEPEKNFMVDNLCKAKNREVFINAIKEYMESLPCRRYVTFNNDYSKFYRPPTK